VIVIADTSPLNYLVLIGEIDVVPELYQTVVIPADVLEELRSPNTPAVVLAWSRKTPDWLHVEVPKMMPADADLAILGKGERAAIALALEHQDALLLIDEGKGRRAAKSRQIGIIGTLGILDMAAARGILDLPAAVKRLQQTNFHVAPRLLGKLLEQDIERKRGRSPQTKG
jgi:predicted nucleic acid-binding protein